MPTEGYCASLVAAACIASSLVVFFLFTYPANQQARNWTVLPENWLVPETGCILRHLEYDQYPELHLYLIAQKA